MAECQFEVVSVRGLQSRFLDLPFANKKRKKKFSERIALHSVCLLKWCGVVGCLLRFVDLPFANKKRKKSSVNALHSTPCVC
jgi:hypothetical protein